MNPGPKPGARAARIVPVLVAACLGLSGCAKRATQVDVGYTKPEGTFSPDARLVVWPATDNTMILYRDEPPIGPSTNDPMIGTRVISDAPAGTIHGMLFDRTAAESYQMMRREPGGGLRLYEDFNRPPVRKWLARQWEIYRFKDGSPSGFQPPSYIGRGLIDGGVTDRAPLSNEASLSTAPLANIDLEVTEDRIAGVDTATVVGWSEVPGAAHYLVHIYEFRAASTSQQQASGLPMPLYDAQSLDHFVLWFRWDDRQPGALARYRLGDTTRTDLDILFQRQLIPQPEPAVSSALVRVSAFDGSGRMIGTTREPAGNPPGSFTVFPRNYGTAPVSDTEYGVYPLGALQVERIRFPRSR